MEDLRDRLRDDLDAALGARAGASIRVLRTVLSAIANAEVQPVTDAAPTNVRSRGVVRPLRHMSMRP